VASAAGPLRFRASYILAEDGADTRVQLVGEMGRCLLPGAVTPLVGAVVRRELATSAERLKSCLEQTLAVRA
jgi:hypothetical protein